MEAWSGKQHAFALKSYYQNGESFDRAQSPFHLHYCLAPRPPVPLTMLFTSGLETLKPVVQQHKKQVAVPEPENIV